MVPVPAFAEADNQQTPTLLFEHIDRHLLAVALLTYVTGICAYMDRINTSFHVSVKTVHSVLPAQPAGTPAAHGSTRWHSEHGARGSGVCLELPRLLTVRTGPNPEPVSMVFPAPCLGEERGHFPNAKESKIITIMNQILSRKSAVGRCFPHYITMNISIRIQLK